MKTIEENREIVEQRFVSAHVEYSRSGEYQIWANHIGYENDPYLKIGTGDSEEEAWENAAQKIPFLHIPEVVVDLEADIDALQDLIQLKNPHARELPEIAYMAAQLRQKIDQCGLFHL
jgi:hypothetical protein